MRRTIVSYIIIIILCTALPSCKWNAWTSPDGEKEDGIALAV